MILRKRPVVVALVAAGIIAGTHAGIAAISNETTEPVADAVAVQTESQAPVEMQADAAAPVALSPEESIVQPKWALAPAMEPQRAASPNQARDQSDEYYVRIPFTNKVVKVTNPTFPSNSSEFRDPHPSVVAYFDRKNANTMLTGAPGSVFPSGGDQAEPLPAVAVYFDRLEARRIAAATPQPVAAPVAAIAPPTAAPETQAQATTTLPESPGT